MNKIINLRNQRNDYQENQELLKTYTKNLATDYLQNAETSSHIPTTLS